MKLDSALLSFVWLFVGLCLFAWGYVVPDGAIVSLSLVGACVCWLVCLWLSLRRWRGRGASGEGDTLEILTASLAVLLVFGCLFYAGWLRGQKQSGAGAGSGEVKAGR